MVSKPEVDSVVAPGHVCCSKRCTKQRKERFGGPSGGGGGEGVARATTTVYRAAFAGTDHTQRVLFHVGRLKALKDVETDQPLDGGPSVVTGESQKPSRRRSALSTAGITDWLYNSCFYGRCCAQLHD